MNFLFCLVFSFTLLFGSVSLVQATDSIQEKQSLKQCIDSKEYPEEIAQCEVNYTVKNINENDEQKIILAIGNREFDMAKIPWYQNKSQYRFGASSVKISDDKKYARIFVSVYRNGFWGGTEKFDLIFEFKVN